MKALFHRLKAIPQISHSHLSPNSNVTVDKGHKILWSYFIFKTMTLTTLIRMMNLMRFKQEFIHKGGGRDQKYLKTHPHRQFLDGSSYSGALVGFSALARLGSASSFFKIQIKMICFQNFKNKAELKCHLKETINLENSKLIVPPFK